ncbi:hypothetical protein [Granulicella rosea]|nr:hypothetical protein [Granulicella rosea]
MFLSAAPKVNPADYTTTVHVISSHWSLGNNGGVQILQALIDGQQVELLGHGEGVLKLGNYKAAPLQPAYHPRPNGHDDNVAYQFLFPTGETRNFDVTGYSTTP